MIPYILSIPIHGSSQEKKKQNLLGIYKRKIERWKVSYNSMGNAVGTIEEIWEKVILSYRAKIWQRWNALIKGND